MLQYSVSPYRYLNYYHQLLFQCFQHYGPRFLYIYVNLFMNYLLFFLTSIKSHNWHYFLSISKEELCIYSRIISILTHGRCHQPYFKTTYFLPNYHLHLEGVISFSQQLSSKTKKTDRDRIYLALINMFYFRNVN